MNPTTLSAAHYAKNWPYGDAAVVRPLEEVNDLGRRYAESGSEDLLLEICKAFHPYLMKYLVMILTGHVALWGTRINKDVEPFIRYFLPRGESLNLAVAGRIVRHLHLAFKGLSTDEMYDVLMEQLLMAVKKYDPKYTEKVKLTAEKIDEVIAHAKSFTVSELNDYLEFDCNKFVRLLCRRGFLAAVRADGKDKRISGWERTETWPAPASFFEAGAIGFAYYLQTWFRYFLQQWIDKSMSQLETREGVYSLNHRNAHLSQFEDNSAVRKDGGLMPHNKGQIMDKHGLHWAADLSLTNKPVDVSLMTLDWVESTEDVLFKDLSKTERLALYLVFNREQSLPVLANTLNLTVAEAKQFLVRVFSKVRVIAESVKGNIYADAA